MKCTVCHGCLDPIWIMPNRYWHCDFCDKWYGGRGELTEIDNPGIIVEKVIKKREQKKREKEILDELGYENDK